MKRTKNMVYKESPEATELRLYAVNNYEVYRTLQYIKKNLKKKTARGIYDSDKAVNSMYRIATLASNEYCKEFGYKFSVQERFTCAVELENDFRGEYSE